ncbi:uncharacterized protein PHACADRAFT_254920 [Phanerochaete carnosa HHB-10118-sp]|uniref:Uncharacterized protein n=1 Tax=Phanerochaete carnosa (strain HHB-10118-sp) TaxID=650164 RepID=K5X364_PHACS|nr:uncharacterized protein PHACADRAFT_254920 [Phanerochaete carnosa HHB-10118-sp]EKM57252.1 hypothetical protein PHACADRAFT_254920 [Phanerochaete carnosa HHB-10118-sp]
MSSEDVSSGPHAAKGKGRARPEDFDERTPLLASGSGAHHDPEPAAPRRRRLFAKLLSVFLYTLSFCVLFFVIVLLIAYSYGSRASGISSDELIQRALVTRGPDRLDVLNVTGDGGIWVKVRGRVGLDAGGVIGVAAEENESYAKYWWKSIGRWGIEQLDTITVNLSTVDIFSKHDYLAEVVIPPLDLPLTADPPDNDGWLTEVTIPVYIQPTKNITALLRFAHESWRDGTMRVEAHVGRAAVRGGHLNESGWRSALSAVRTDVVSHVSMRVPHLPGLPRPGTHQPLPPASQLVTLTSFKLESNDSQLAVYANATAINPTPENFHYAAGPIPFTIALPAKNSSQQLIPVAAVHTAPFTLTHPNISVSLAGHILPLTMNASAAVSRVLANYVSARDSEVSVSCPLLPGFNVTATFPALRPKPRILRDVTIKNMKIKSGLNGGMLASGTVFARIVLPLGFHVGLNVSRVLPDVLVFDGAVPIQDKSSPAYIGDAPPAPPLPDPLPDRAFGHIRPDDWVPSMSFPIESGEHEGTAVEVYADMVDVPLEILPGRDRQFRNFVGKVIFSANGAVAGVQGVAAVAVDVQGLPLEHGEMELEGLPFRGRVRIGKDTLLL